MKILYLTKYSRNGASSRLRSYQYFPYFEKEGFTITVKPFFDDAYLKDFYDGRKNFFSVIQSYIRRFFVLFTVFRFDKIVIEKEIFPFLPAFAERLLYLLKKEYIVDYDDAIFHNYDQNPNPFVRKLLRNKIAKVMKYSSMVIVGNDYLAEYAVKAESKEVEIIPTVIDLIRYPIKENSNREKFIVGWIGTKTTFEKQLLFCRDWIKEIQSKNTDIWFHIVGITHTMDLGENVKYIPWDEETEVQEILKMDIGIMPFQSSLFEKGKCAYKLIQYAACGIPGVASDVGMNREVCINGETGFLAATDEDWIQKILELKNNPKERNQMGRNARKLVEEKYCIQVTANKWIKILSE